MQRKLACEPPHPWSLLLSAGMRVYDCRRVWCRGRFARLLWCPHLDARGAFTHPPRDFLPSRQLRPAGNVVAVRHRGEYRCRSLARDPPMWHSRGLWLRGAKPACGLKCNYPCVAEGNPRGELLSGLFLALVCTLHAPLLVVLSGRGT